MTQKLQAAFKACFQAENRRRLLVAVGIVGIALLALSEWLPGGEKTAAEQTDTVIMTAAQVETALEARITRLIETVEGVGACHVMVTLESGAQTVYAAHSAAVSAQGSDGSANKSTEETLLVVETESGPVGLAVTEIQPTVKGVAVTCQGGDDPAVCQSIVDLVSTAFHISERRVCVAKQK